MSIKRVLITGSNSYVGTNVEKRLMKEPDKFYVETISVRGDAWKSFDFSKFDVVFHVAGIAHTKTNNKFNQFIEINYKKTIELALVTKEKSIKHFIFMSSMAVYGEDGVINKQIFITKNTPVMPKSNYACSKYWAESTLNLMADNNFRLSIVRSPMIFGPNSPGNYSRLESLVKRFSFFPKISNMRSLVHIDTLSEKIALIIKDQIFGLILPQEKDYISTSSLISTLASKHNKKVYFSPLLGFLVKIIGNKFKILRKLFGNLTYTIEDRDINGKN